MSSSNRFFLHIVRNSVVHDSRVLKETGSLLEFYPHFQVLIAGFLEPGSSLSLYENLGGRLLKRFSLSSRHLPKNLLAQFVKYIEWHCRVVAYCSKFDIAIIHCHDLAPLAISVHLKFITGAKLIYDAHELETETNGLSGLRKILAKLFEKYLVKLVDAIVTVSPSIAVWYKNNYRHKHVSLVRNIPSRKLVHQAKSISLRDIYGLEDGDLLFIYLGGICNGRGIEAILNSFADPSVKHHVLFMGHGPIVDEVVSAVAVNSRIHYLEPVPPSEVIYYINSADVGLCLIEDVCLSYRYCLPNKLFECLVSGLPVLASNLPDQSKLVTLYKAGWVVGSDIGLLKTFLGQITADQVTHVKSGLNNRTSSLSWENEQWQLMDLYNCLLLGIT